MISLTRCFQVRRAIKGFVADNADYERLLPYVVGKWIHLVTQEEERKI